jgi:LCP family protein required for cell wall assembly
VVVGAGLVAVGGGFFYVTSQLNAAGIEVFSTDGETFTPPTAAEINGPINVLVVGSDTREDQGDTNYGEVGTNLADVIILVHISEDRSNAVAMSFPRDLMVPVPACPNPNGGEPYPAREFVQINSTMNYGGPACTLLAVQALTGVTIPYLGVIDFKGVIAMSEAIGGVEVCVSEPINDDKSKLYLDAGYHTLEGADALAFLRTRYGVGDGSDLSRISNQQVFLTSLVRKLKDEGALTNPFTMFRLATAALENMTLSKSLTDISVLFGIAREVNDVDLDKITFIKLPVYDLDGDYAGRVAAIPERSQLLFDLIANDEPLILEKANPGTGAVVVEDPATDEEPVPAGDSDLEQTPGDSGSTAEPTPEPLPTWVQGTNASVTSCSK